MHSFLAETLSIFAMRWFDATVNTRAYQLCMFFFSYFYLNQSVSNINKGLQLRKIMV